jgi:peptide/nickel transport system substrate-binding protein
MKKLLAVLISLVLSLGSLALGQQAEQPQRGGTVQIALQTTPGSLNPVLPAELASNIINWTMFSPLTVVNPYTNQLEPYLAERWETNANLTEWTFYIRRNAFWHDGRPVTSEDVKFTFDKIRDPEEGANNLPDFRRVREIRTVGPYAVKVFLTQPDAFFDDRLSLGGSEILPRHIFSQFRRLRDATEFNSRTPIGSGPFKMKRAVPGQFFELEANDKFFLGRPNLDGLVFRVVPDGNTRVTQLLAGQLDWIEMEPTQIRAVQGNPRVKTTNFDTLRYQIFAWNLKNPLFQDLKVREAMVYAIDRRRLLQTVTPGFGYVDDAFVPKAVTWIPRPNIQFREYNPQRARQLLAEAGWRPNAQGILEKDGKPFEFKILIDRGNVQREQIGLILQQYFQDIGMKVTYDVAERGGRWLQETQQGTFETRLAEFLMPNIDWMQRLFSSVGQNNSQFYSNPRVDNLLAQMRATSNRAQHANFMRQIQEELYATFPNIPLYYMERILGTNVRLQGFPAANIKDAMPFIHRVWLRSN